jgi:endonuclease/exonuclease/phosphatase family metal-dependent hydrolase
MACQVSHQNQLFPPTLIVNIYAPAQYPTRKDFYHRILQLPFLRPSSINISNDLAEDIDEDLSPTNYTRPMLVMGDFNYNAIKYAKGTIDSTAYSLDSTSFSFTPGPATTADTTTAQQLWHEFLQQNFRECTHARNTDQLLPTFRRGSSASTIDYIYASPILYQSLRSSDIEFLSSKWTDRALLSATFQFKSSRQGPGL